MKKFRRILRITIKAIIIAIIAVVLLFAGFLIFSTVRDYQPEAVSELEVVKPEFRARIFQNEFSLITWNIGYCGLGADMDFFFDGGRKVRPSDEQYQKYLNGVYNILANYDTVDFMLLQEVDRKARRSFSTDQADILRKGVPVYTYTHALNYNADFVPLPLTNPMGSVESGLMTFSLFVPEKAQRYSFPVNFSWPKKLFMPDRCFLLERFALPDGKELIIINTHNSAYDTEGRLRRHELWMLRSFMLAEYEKGNYVIAGGDWNQNPAGDEKITFKDKYVKNPEKCPMEEGFLPPQWKWCFDPDYPTNRNLNESYEHGSTLTTIIDYFVASPNLEVITTRAICNDFEYSDHHPVYLKVRLIEDPVALSSPECKSIMSTLRDSITRLNEYMDKRLGKVRKKK